MKFNFRFVLIICFIISTGIQTFGLGFYWFAIPIGDIKITEGVFIFVILTFYSFIISGKKVNWGDSSILPIFLLVIILTLQVIKNILIDRMSLLDILIRAPIFICLYFAIPLAYQIETRKQLQKMVSFLLLIGFISNTIAIIQLFLPSLWGGRLTVVFGIVRPDNPAIVFSVFSLFYSLAYIFLTKGKGKKKLFFYFLASGSILAVFLTLGRGIIFAAVLGVITLSFAKNKIKGKTVQKYQTLKIILFVFLVMVVFSVLTNYRTGIFWDRVTEGITEFSTGEKSGSVGVRRGMTNVKILTNLEESPVMGRGWNFTNDKGITSLSDENMRNYYNPYSVNGDSTLPNIFILYGLVGLFVFIFFFISYLKNSYELAKISKEFDLSILSFSLIPIPIFIFFHSFGSSYFNNTNLIFMTVMSVLLYDLKIINQKTLDKK